MSTAQKILDNLKTAEQYKQVRSYVDSMSKNDQSLYQPLQDAIVQAIKNKSPIQCLMAVRLAKECVETKNLDFIASFQKNCLPSLEGIAEFRKDDQTDDRGKLLFSNTPDKTQSSYGNSTLRLVLESIQVWAQIYPFNKDQITPTQFYEAYARLKQKKVKFPQLQYYKADEVKKQISPQFTEPSNNPSIIVEQQIKQQIQQQPIQQVKQQPLQQNFIQTPAPKEINQSAQQIINKFNNQKQLLTYEVCKMENSGQSHDIILEWKKKLDEMRIQFDKKIDELLHQDDEDSSMELMNAQDELTHILTDTNAYLEGQITFAQYKAKFQVQRNNGYKNGNLHSIQEESENNSGGSSMMQQVKKPVGNKQDRQDSIGLNYNTEQVFNQFQSQLREMREQNAKELEILEQEHQMEVNNLKRQITELQQKQSQENKRNPSQNSEQLSNDYQKQINSLKEQNAREIENLEQKHKNEVMNLKKQIQDSSNDNKGKPQNQNLQQMINEYQQQNKFLQDQYKKDMELKNQQHNFEIQNLQLRIAEQKNITDIQEKQITEYKKIEQQKNELEKQIAVLRKQVNQQSNSTSSNTDEVRRENQNLKEQLKVYEMSKKDFEQQKQLLIALKQEISQLKEQNTNQAKEIYFLKAQLEKNQENNSQMFKLSQLNQINLNDKDLDGETKRKVEHERQLNKKRVEELLQEIKQKDDKIRFIEQQYQEARQKLQVAEQKQYQIELKAEANKKIDQVKDQDKDNEINKLKDSIRQIEEKNKLQQSHLQDSIIQLENARKDLIQQNTKLQINYKVLTESKLHTQQQENQICQKCEQYKNNLEEKEIIVFKLKKELEGTQTQLKKSASPSKMPSRQHTQEVYRQVIQPIVPILSEPYQGYSHFSRNRLELEPIQLLSQSLMIPLPIDQTIIYPYSSARQYYQNAKTKRKILGTKVQQQQSNLLQSLSQQNLINYKFYHLKSQDVLQFHDGRILKIGIKRKQKKVGASLYLNYGIYMQTEVQSLQVTLTIRNLTDFSNCWSSNQEYVEIVERNSQSLIELSLQLTEKPRVLCPILELNYDNKISVLYLPNIIFSLINFSKVNLRNLENDWEVLKVYRSYEFDYDNQLLQDYREICRINENFEIVNDNINSYLQEVSELRFAAKFSVDFIDLRGIMQIELIPDNKMIIYVGVKDNSKSSEIISLISSFQMMFQLNQI